MGDPFSAASVTSVGFTASVAIAVALGRRWESGGEGEEDSVSAASAALRELS